eukprot:356671-Chlamydomonas_euryale.AAC.1
MFGMSQAVWKNDVPPSLTLPPCPAAFQPACRVVWTDGSILCGERVAADASPDNLLTAGAWQSGGPHWVPTLVLSEPIIPPPLLRWEDSPADPCFPQAVQSCGFVGRSLPPILASLKQCSPAPPSKPKTEKAHEHPYFCSNSTLPSTLPSLFVHPS